MVNKTRNTDTRLSYCHYAARVSLQKLQEPFRTCPERVQGSMQVHSRIASEFIHTTYNICRGAVTTWSDNSGME